MSTETSTPATSGNLYIDGHVPRSVPDTDPVALENGQVRAYLVELHKFGDIDDLGQIGDHHYQAVYATVTGSCATRVRVDGTDDLRATLPVYTYEAHLVPQDARDRFAERILDLHVEDGGCDD